MKRLILVLTLLWPMSLLGDYSGNDMMEYCDGTDVGEPKQHVVFAGTCFGYLIGIISANETLRESGQLKKPGRVCLAEGVTADQLRQVFLKHMRQHPENWHLPGSVLMLNALKGTWPCKE